MFTAEIGEQYGQVSQYDKRERMTDRSSINLAGYTVLNDHWDYDPAGNVMDAVDSAQGTMSYQYDALNRVIDGSLPPFETTYGYDAWGNQTAHSLQYGSGYQWEYTPTTRNQASSPGAAYDASGNMIADGGP